MTKQRFKITTKDIALISLMSIMLFIQEQILSFLPNIQLTIFLLILYSKKMGLFKTILTIVIYVILDNITVGGMGLIYIPFMIIGWLIIPILLNTAFKKINNFLFLSLLGILFSFIYSWTLIVPSCILFQMNFLTYLSGDLIWELTLAMSSFISILLLYKPCSIALDKFNESLN